MREFDWLYGSGRFSQDLVQARLRLGLRSQEICITNNRTVSTSLVVQRFQ